MSARVLTLRPSLLDRVCAAIAPSRGGGAGLGARARPDWRTPASSGDPGPLRAAEAERFKTLMLPHLDAAFGFARFLCRDSVAAEDLVQDAYLKAFRAFPTYRDGEPKAWLFAIVRRSFLDWARGRRTSEAVTGSLDAVPVDPATEDLSPEEALVRADDVAGLRRAVDALPDPYRETLVLRELQEMSYRAIADLTGAPIGTVMSRLARARTLLIEALRPGPADGEGAAP
jgi:RNA polymerase sigma factor (sigma-70 family)